MDSFSDALFSTPKSRPLSDVLHIFILLLIGKFLKTLTLFITYDLLKSYHLIFILFLTTLIASAVLLFVQRPFSSSLRLNRTLLTRLLKYTIGLTLIRLLWLFGLSLCGPLRTILLFEHSDLVILACGHVVFSSSNAAVGQQHGQTARIRGVVFFILAILAILAFDNDDATQQVSVALLINPPICHVRSLVDIGPSRRPFPSSVLCTSLLSNHLVVWRCRSHGWSHSIAHCSASSMRDPLCKQETRARRWRTQEVPRHQHVPLHGVSNPHVISVYPREQYFRTYSFVDHPADELHCAL